LIVGLLRDRRSGNEQCRDNPFFHGTRMIYENREYGIGKIVCAPQV
jgi:hypothetical protein